MSSNNSRRSQSVNSNNNNNSQNTQNSRKSLNTNDLQSSAIQTCRGKSKQQNKKLQQLKLNLDDLNAIYSCYQTREDNIFQMRVYIMQILENIQGRSQFEIQNSIRHICSIMQETEKFRINQENQVIQKYSSPIVQPIILEANSNTKQIVFKFGSKLNKMNNAYFQKIQFYFPRMAELIQQETCTWNSLFKESLSSTMSQSQTTSMQNSQQSNYQYNQSSSQGFGNVFNQNGVTLVTYLNHVIMKSRQKFQKEHNKLLYYQQSYSGLIEKTAGIQRTIDKCNKNEKFYIDKYIQGSSAFTYTKYLIQKYLIKSSFKFTQLGITPQMRSILKQTWKNPYDILLLEDKIVDNKTPIIKVTQNQSQQGNGQPISSSCVSTSKTTSKSESILEIIVTNYDKNIKEMLQSNKFINNQIRNYIESYSKRQQNLQIQQQNMLQNSQIKKNVLNKQFQSQQMLSPPQNNNSQTIGSANQLQQRNEEDLSKNSIKNQIQNIQENFILKNSVISSIEVDQQQNKVKKIENTVCNNNELQQDNCYLELINNQSEIKNGMQNSSFRYNQEKTLSSKSEISTNYNNELSQVKQRIISQTGEKSIIQNDSISQIEIASISNKAKEQSYSTYIDDDIIKTQSQIFHKQMSGSNFTASSTDKKNKANFYLDEQISDINDKQATNYMTDNGIEAVTNSKYLKDNYGISESNNFYIMNSNNFKTSNIYKPREKSLTFNHTIQLDNILATPQEDTEQLKYYTHSKNKSYQDSMAEYQFIRRMKSNDSKNQTQRTCELEESSFQYNGNNPYRVLKPSNIQQGFQAIEDVNKIVEGYTLSQQMKQQAASNLNGPIQSSNSSSKQLQRVIISPFQNDIIQNNKNSNQVFTKQNGNSLQIITPKLNQQKTNSNSQNTNKFTNNGINSVMNNINSNNNVNTNNFQSQNKQNQMRFSVTSIQKQIDLSCIEQFNQIFESKKKSLNLMCQSVQNSQTSSLILSNQTSQGYQQNQSQQINQNMNSNQKQNNQNYIFSQPSNIISQNDDTNQDSSEQNKLSKKQKQIKSFTITSREGNNLIQNGVQQETTQTSCLNSINMTHSGSSTDNTTPLNNQQSQQQSLTQNNINSQIQIQTNRNLINNQTANNINLQYTPIIKNNVQLKTRQQIYSGPNQYLSSNHKNQSTTPIKSINTIINTTSQKKQLTSSDQVFIEPLNTISSSINNINFNNLVINQDQLQLQLPQIQMQKNYNPNIDQNTYTQSTLYDQAGEYMYSEPLFTQQQTLQIEKNMIGLRPDNFHLMKQNQKNYSKTPFEQTNQLGQFINLNQSNIQQPVFSRINKSEKGSFSPLKLDTIDARRQTQTNNQNFQLNTIKRNDHFRTQNIIAVQNNIQQTQSLTSGGNIFQKGNTQISQINQNRNKNNANSNQFVIKKNNNKNYENKTTPVQVNKNSA